MEICISEHNGKMVAVLLDDEMKIVKPVYDFLRPCRFICVFSSSEKLYVSYASSACRVSSAACSSRNLTSISAPFIIYSSRFWCQRIK